MLSQSRKDHCKKAWSRVKKQYCSGWIVSERGLQAALYSELKKELSTSSHIVVEPTWKTDNKPKKTPDLVIVENDQITDIFELKFVPYDLVKWENDIEKLRLYVGESDAKYSVRLCPKTGKWRSSFPIKDGCRLHFVAISHHDAEAVDPCLTKDSPRINHWYGPTGDSCNKWGISFAQAQ